MVKGKQKYALSDHFGPRHWAIGANLSPMAHENMTHRPKWPLKILDGANLNLNCAEKINTSNVIL